MGQTATVPKKAELVSAVSRIEERSAIFGTYILDAKLHVRAGEYTTAHGLLEMARRELETLDEAIGKCRNQLLTA